MLRGDQTSSFSDDVLNQKNRLLFQCLCEQYASQSKKDLGVCVHSRWLSLESYLIKDRCFKVSLWYAKQQSKTNLLTWHRVFNAHKKTLTLSNNNSVCCKLLEYSRFQ